MMKLPESVILALRNKRPLEDNRLEALRSFAAAVVKQRGHLSQSEIDRLLSAGYTGATILAVITAVALKTVSNYANHIAETPLDQAFQPHEWKA
jgi:alkylhydroperoxidase family enzyme